MDRITILFFLKGVVELVEFLSLTHFLGLALAFLILSYGLDHTTFQINKSGVVELLQLMNLL